MKVFTEDNILELHRNIAIDYSERNKWIKIYNLETQSVIKYPKIHKYSPIQFPYPKGIKIDILCLCSVIHTPSAAVFIDSANEFLGTDIDMQIKFFTTSKDAVSFIEYQNDLDQPLIVTVTDGAANKLDNNFDKYLCKKALDCIPGKLRWTNPHFSDSLFFDQKKILDTKFHIIDHPTDIMAFQSFIEHLKAKHFSKEILDKISNNLVFIDFVPEKLDFYRTLGKNDVALTANFLDGLAGKKYSYSPWSPSENRFIYFNKSLIDKSLIFAKWFQRYLSFRFSQLLENKTQYWKSLIKSDRYNDCCWEYLNL